VDGRARLAGAGRARDGSLAGGRLPPARRRAAADRPEDDVVGHLGPDVLGPDWDAAEAVRRLLAHPEREVGLALLDQRLLAGLGNLYRTEVLFLQGLTPWVRVADVPDLPALVERGRRLMAANRGRWEQSTTGSLRTGEMHWVFERAGRPCRRCGTRPAVGGAGRAARARLSYWCPHCQRGPAPAAGRRHRARRDRRAGRTRYTA
jgi:endonuclease-8